MPTVLRSGPYAFHFFAGDEKERPHIHVRGGGNKTKLWIVPAVDMVRNEGFRKSDVNRIIVNRIIRIAGENREYLLGEWHAFFGDRT